MAPLKLDSPVPAVGASDGFPRLQKRGPIEALSPEIGSVTVLLFPRLQKRGPIEALRFASLGLRAVGFHAYKSVAPLKRSRGR